MKNLLNATFQFLLILSAAMLLPSCEEDDGQFDNGGNPNDQEEITIDTPCRYSITLIDSEFTHDASTGNRQCMLSSTGSNDPNTGIYTRIPGAGLIDMDMGYGLTLSRGTVSFDVTQTSAPANEDFKALFAEGDYSFSMDAANGFQVTFMDDNGVEWTSSDPDQINNSNWLKIHESVSGERLGDYYTTIRGEFSCGVVAANGDIAGCSGSFVMSFMNE